MIISDLSHFEEVVSEAPNIVGGSVTLVTADQLLTESIRAKLSPEHLALLKKSKVKLNTVSGKKKGGSTSKTTGSLTEGGVKVEFSASSSSS